MQPNWRIRVSTGSDDHPQRSSPHAIWLRKASHLRSAPDDDAAARQPRPAPDRYRAGHRSRPRRCDGITMCSATPSPSRISPNGSELIVDSSFRAEHFPLPESEVTSRGICASLSVQLRRLGNPRYRPNRRAALSRSRPRGRCLGAPFRHEQRDADTMAILLPWYRRSTAEFSYNPRDEMGTQDPLVTLHSGSGTAAISRCS